MDLEELAARAVYPAGQNCCGVITFDGLEVWQWIGSMGLQAHFGPHFKELKANPENTLIVIGNQTVGNSVISYLVVGGIAQGKIIARAYVIFSAPGHEECARNLIETLLAGLPSGEIVKSFEVN